MQPYPSEAYPPPPACQAKNPSNGDCFRAISGDQSTGVQALCVTMKGSGNKYRNSFPNMVLGYGWNAVLSARTFWSFVREFSPPLG